MDVSIVIVSYNSSDVLRACLASIHGQDFTGSLETIVVDNASSDGSADLVAREFPWVRLLAGRDNLGYSRGVNVGIRMARGRYFFVLNPDTILRPDSVRRLADFADRTPDAGVVGPKLVYHDGNTQLSCRRFYTFRVLLLRRTPLGRIFHNSKAVREHLMEDFDHASTRAVDWVLGGAMFVRRSAVESVGMMDERFFLYFEDVDWCYRMKQMGLGVYYHPEAVVTHGYRRESAHRVINRSFIAHMVSLFRYYEKWNAVWYFLKRYREILKVLLFLVLDVAAFNLAFFSAYYLRTALGGLFTNPIFPVMAYEKFVIFENLLFVFTFAAFGLYKVRRETRYADELFSIGRAIVVASVLLMTSTYLGQIRTYSRMVVAFVVPFAVFYDWGLRSLVRHVHHRLLALKVDLKRACIVGPMDQAREMEARLMRDDRIGFDVVGVVDTAGQSEAILTGSLGRLDDMERVVEKYRVQEVVVLPGVLSDDQLAALVQLARRRMVDVTVLTDYTGLVFYQPVISDLQGRPTITYPRDTRLALDRALKRALDIVAGAAFLVVSVPFSVIYSLYALSRGARPFSYTDRLGLEGVPFAVPAAGRSVPDGPSDLVNSPLFWLVVIGRMSMVGPYAVQPEDVRALPPGAKFRFEVRPGITGYWRATQSHTLDLEDVLAQDAKYIRNSSLLEDLKILAVTSGRMFLGRRRMLEITRRTSSEGGHRAEA